MLKSLLLAILLIPVFAYAQPLARPNVNPSPFSQYGQLLNLSNTHPSVTKDSTSGTLYLTTGYWNNNAAVPTYLPTLYPVIGRGLITFTQYYVKASSTSTLNPVCVSTPQGSNDGYSWTNIPGVTAATVTPTAVYSATVTPASAAWEFADNYFLYYRIKNTVTTDTAAIVGSYYLNKNFTYSR